MKLPRFQFNREKYNLKNAGPYLVAYFVPVLVLVIIFIEKGIWPVGNQCFLRTDLYHQYAPFFRELKRKLSEGGSLFYSWNIGGGTNYWALSAYYLASPLNILIVFWPKNYIIEFITFQIVNKLALCSLTLTYYLNKRHDKHGPAGYPAAFFGVFYALSGYMAAYNWNVMWLDCIWLFPLVILGLERLVKENKGLLYSFTLGLTIFSNYYIAIMVCMGIAVYCFFLLGTEREMRKNFGIKLLKFIGYTALALAFSAVYLVPYIAYFGMTASATGTFKWDWLRTYFSVFSMMARHLANVETHTGLDHWPNIYCGVAVFLCVPFYYLNKRISLREKIGYTCLLIFFYFSFASRTMDYIWHGLHIPNSLPCRQAFIYIFLLLVISYRGFLGVKERSYRDLTFVMLGALIFTFMAEKLETDTTYYANYVFYGSAVFMILYTILLYAYRRGRVLRDVLIVLMIALAALETCIDMSITSVSTVSRIEYTNYDEAIEEILPKIELDEGSEFYRVEKVSNRTKNDGSWLGYHTISTFSSVANANLTDFYKTIGLESSTNAYGSMGQTPFTEMLLGVRYLVSQTELKDEGNLYKLYDMYTSTAGRGKDQKTYTTYVYRNNYTLPLGYMLQDHVIPGWSDEGATPLENQNQLAGLVAGTYDLFLDVTPNYKSEKKITMTIPESGFYYAYSTKSGPKEVQAVHSGFSKKFQNLNRSYTMDLGWCEEGDTLTFENVEADSTKLLDVKLYRFQTDLMPEVYEAFSRSTMKVLSYTDTNIEAEIDVAEAGQLLTTIGNEEGWEVFVDGEKAEITEAKGAYISLTLTEGHHTLSFRYHVPYFSVSLVITIFAGLIMLVIAVLSKLLEIRRQTRFDEIAEVSAAQEMFAVAENESPADDNMEPLTLPPLK
ncbi:MAG: YfhO family protein [Lachnospiraceae bacterium]|nr:YfhO family protein [Lachnospiraceae bacterium]